MSICRPLLVEKKRRIVFFSNKRYNKNRSGGSVMQKQKNDIAYQNKDIASKIFAEQFRGKSLKVYGIDLPRVKQVLPTNLPNIQANELRLDNLFLLEDNTFLIIDYESAYRKKNKIKYLKYTVRVLEQYCDEYGIDMQISVVILYTADVLEYHTKDRLDVGCLQLTIKEAFLAQWIQRR